LHLRQVALAARQLEPVVEELCELLDVEVAWRDPGVAAFGLENAVLPVGRDFLEVVSPVHGDAPAARFLRRRGGDGGYMAIFQTGATGDLESCRPRLRELGVRIVWEIALEDIATLHLHPRDLGGAIVSLDEARPPETWRWAGPDWEGRRASRRVSGLCGVLLRAAEPERLARRWAAVLDRPVVAGEGAGRWRIPLEGGDVHVEPAPEGEPEGLAGVALRATDADAVRAAAGARRRLGADGDVRVGGVRLDLCP